jgi:hypothetical protein
MIYNGVEVYTRNDIAAYLYVGASWVAGAGSGLACAEQH